MCAFTSSTFRSRSGKKKKKGELPGDELQSLAKPPAGQSIHALSTAARGERAAISMPPSTRPSH